ncbi:MULTISPECIES: GtrA family protein [Cobetia]|uniref:GtrA family protein n=1 Tax=Cobetia TaxID=204286 RepID=UPI001132413E|nr:MULTISPECIES: GtrA family protein [Cobetia]
MSAEHNTQDEKMDRGQKSDGVGSISSASSSSAPHVGQRAKQEAGTATRFGLVGLAATGVHLAVAATMLALWPGLNEFIANIVAFCIAFQVSLIGHRRLTFKRQGSAWRFALVAAGGFALNNGLLAVLMRGLDLSGFLAIAIATLSVPIVTYMASRLWAFKEEHA